MSATDERFWTKAQQADNSDCWQWIGRKTGEGYGQFYLVCTKDEQLLTGAHRYAYTALRSEIPSGLVIDHLCRNRACVNPWHMEPVPQQVNVLRSQPYIERPELCPQGHRFTETNTYRTPRGHRRCKTCNRDRARRNHAERTI